MAAGREGDAGRKKLREGKVKEKGVLKEGKEEGSCCKKD